MKESYSSRYLSRRSFLAKASASVLALAVGGTKVFAQNTPAWDPNMQLLINFEVLAPGSGRYKKPYVAVWIEDSLGFPVRTLLLWVQTGKGNRWIPDLKRWYRGEQNRKNTYGGDLITAVSSPTRLAGQYSLVWDGLNDANYYVYQGDYYLCVESAREHGPYSLIREKISLGTTPFSQTLQGNQELGGVGIEYRSGGATTV
ncbi:MAG: DUF2271 domain-containing protein [Deinococcales bacterium]